MSTPYHPFYIQGQRAEVLADVRDILGEYPFLWDRGPDHVRKMLRMTRGVAVSEFEVANALDSLRGERGELLA